jgi:uncharacterized protein (UPF0335 family)
LKVQNAFDLEIVSRLLKMLREKIKELRDGILKITDEQKTLNDEIKSVFAESMPGYIDKRTQNLCKMLSVLSYNKYERRDNEGTLVFIDESQKKHLQSDCFEAAIRFNDDNIRLARKLIEGTNPQNSLLISDGNFIGYGNPSDSLCRVVFVKSHHWKFSDTKNLGKETCIEYKNGVFEYKSTDKRKEPLLEEVAEKIFSGENSHHQDDFRELIETIRTGKGHGAIIIITTQEQADIEANRLHSAQHCIKIKDPMEVSDKDAVKRRSDNYASYSEIDGALLIDTSFNCHAISCILDGNADKYGNLSRGSRYNSPLVYIANKKDNLADYYAVILSEDGSMDILFNKSAEKEFRFSNEQD